MANEKSEVSLGIRNLPLIWLALTVSMGMYGFALFMSVKANPPEPSTEAVDSIRFGLTALAAFFGVVSIIVKKLFIDELRTLAWLNRKFSKIDSSQNLAALATRAIESRYSIGCLMSWVLNETIVICGFVPALITRDLVSFIPFLIAGIVMNLSMKPDKEFPKKRVEKWLSSRTT